MKKLAAPEINRLILYRMTEGSASTSSSSPTDPDTAHATRRQPDQLGRPAGMDLDLQSR